MTTSWPYSASNSPPRVAKVEADARRISTGGVGHIDLLWPWLTRRELNRAHKSLGKAEEQELVYLDLLSAENYPAGVVTPNSKRIRIRDLECDNEACFTFNILELTLHP
jgi:hypothetical protein